MPSDAFKPPVWQRTLDPGRNDDAGFLYGIRPDCLEKEKEKFKKDD
jgi:hypothetical protein